MVSRVAKDLMGFIMKAFEDKLGLHETAHVVYGYIRQFLKSIEYMRTLKKKKMFVDGSLQLEVYYFGGKYMGTGPTIEWDGVGVLEYVLEK
jgi:hypothetical protein